VPKSESFWREIIPVQPWLTILASYTKQVISDLLQNKVDMSQLVITKALAKTGRHEIM
jgi:hypothetical protein